MLADHTIDTIFPARLKDQLDCVQVFLRIKVGLGLRLHEYALIKNS